MNPCLLEPPILSFADHAAKCRAEVRQRIPGGDCIHYAPNVAVREWALYEAANASGAAWWTECIIGLLPDGRMVITGSVCSIAEVIASG